MLRLDKTERDLLLLSFIALFLELAIIRWLSSEIRIFAYFKNLPLMGAFLGFGVGFLLHERAERLFPWFPRLFFYLSVVIAGAYGFGLTHVVFVDPRQFFLYGVGFGDHAAESIPSLLQTLKALVVICGVFFLVVATFAMLTTRLGVLLNAGTRPLRAYSVNVAGSLLGIVGFSVVSYLQLPPAAWLLLGLAPLLHFYGWRLRPAGFYFGATVAAALIMGLMHPAVWSPYYRVSVVEPPAGDTHGAIHVLLNYDGSQAMQDLSPGHLALFDEATRKNLSRHYNIPYQLARRPVESVLILGGGSGNDAAAALRNGATHVDVVEIDPVIARLGRDRHPENPYRSDRLELHVDDARSFLHKTQRKYDLVVFATLDAYAAFSSLSSLRLDNFVFTEDSIASVRDLLTPGGGIAINFFAIKPWLTQRHHNTLAAQMPGPILEYGSPQNQEVLFMAGDLFDADRGLGTTDYERLQPPFTDTEVEPTTDDWPFLFLEERGIPFHYLLPLMLILGLAVLPLRLARVRAADLNWHLFFMGAAFLLMETKAVTTLALLIGSTWIVNSVVIGTILLMILVANAAMERLPNASFPLLYAGLFATLLFNFFFSFDVLNQLSWSVRVLAGGFIIGLPIFFAALVFATAFATVASPSRALAANIFGSLVGGVLEYLDMWVGLSWLNIVALVLYALSAVALLRQRGAGRSATTPMSTAA